MSKKHTEYTHRRISDGKPVECGRWDWRISGNGYGRWVWTRTKTLES